MIIVSQTSIMCAVRHKRWASSSSYHSNRINAASTWTKNHNNVATAKHNVSVFTVNFRKKQTLFKIIAMIIRSCCVRACHTVASACIRTSVSNNINCHRRTKPFRFGSLFFMKYKHTIKWRSIDSGTRAMIDTPWIYVRHSWRRARLTTVSVSATDAQNSVDYI